MTGGGSSDDNRAIPGTIVGVPTSGPVTPAVEPDRLPMGTELLGRYRVLERLGEGGMATVYRGVHTTIQKAVALKVLRAEYASRRDPVARFLQEARAASKIRQPNVVEISDFGETDGLVFCVMEYLEGEDLAETSVREGALPWPRVCRMAVQICAALSAAHDAGIVHRDLKPENIFRIQQGREQDFIKVLDFGIAHVVRDPANDDGLRPKTKVGLIAGTPAYMSPEQARGAKIDLRTDIYALGAMLFELLTGQVPFEADSAAEILAMQLHAPIPDPRELIPELPSRLSALVMRALAKDREERFSSMAEVADELEAIYAESILGAGLPGSPESLQSGLNGTLRPTPRPELAKEISGTDPDVGTNTTGPNVVPTPSVLTEPRRSWLPWAVVAVLLLGGGAWWLSQGDADTEPTTPTQVATTPTPAVTPTPTVAEPSPEVVPAAANSDSGSDDGSDGGSDEPPSTGEPPPVEDATVTVRFSTNVEASVYDANGTMLGTTSQAGGLSLPQGDEPIDLVLKRPGYRDESLTIATNESSTVKASLRRERRRPGKTRPGDRKSDTPVPSDDGGSPASKLSEVKNPFADDG